MTRISAGTGISRSLCSFFGDDPYLFVFNRVLDTFIGIGVGLAVNNFRLPVKHDIRTLCVSGIDDVLISEDLFETHRHSPYRNYIRKGCRHYDETERVIYLTVLAEKDRVLGPEKELSEKLGDKARVVTESSVYDGYLYLKGDHRFLDFEIKGTAEVDSSQHRTDYMPCYLYQSRYTQQGEGLKAFYGEKGRPYR